jgi:hypothetical protein
VSHESLVRTAAVVAAAALLAAPYRQQIAGYVAKATEAAKSNGPALGRLAAAALLIAAAWGKVPLPSLPSTPAVPSYPVLTPSDEMQRLVTPVAKALANLNPADRALWAQTWTKAGVVVAGDAVTTEVAFTDTRSLRAFTALALDIAWRRIGRHQPGEIPGLRDAVEEAYNAAIGRDVVPVDASMRQRFKDFAEAVAWAGMNGG